MSVVCFMCPPLWGRTRYLSISFLFYPILVFSFNRIDHQVQFYSSCSNLTKGSGLESLSDVLPAHKLFSLVLSKPPSTFGQPCNIIIKYAKEKTSQQTNHVDFLKNMYMKNTLTHRIFYRVCLSCDPLWSQIIFNYVWKNPILFFK